VQWFVYGRRSCVCRCLLKRAEVCSKERKPILSLLSHLASYTPSVQCGSSIGASLSWFQLLYFLFRFQVSVTLLSGKVEQSPPNAVPKPAGPQVLNFSLETPDSDDDELLDAHVVSGESPCSSACRQITLSLQSLHLKALLKGFFLAALALAVHLTLCCCSMYSWYTFGPFNRPASLPVGR
jgi:hypothetical protein